MPVLVVLNGPPGIGKTTVAHRYAADHPLALALDVDLVRDQIGAWRDDPHAAGLAARDLAVAMARTHLLSGHDVVVAQLVARPGLLERLEALADEVGARHVEVVLTTGPDDAVARAARHPTRPVAAAEARDLVDLVAAHVATRLRAVVVESVAGREDETYRAVLDAVSRVRA